ncbi:MAG: ubiquitin-like protein Pup [Bowdeniella nasicola]|nr:ubiquitin-like protein Pup [Bowdeniella nasicola]
MKREYVQPQQAAPQEVDEEDVTIQPAAQTDDMDALLDEIDGVLEANAESFVQGFVQKGGQ